MLSYRSYRNTDPPHLLRIWADATGRPGLIQPLTLAYLERGVLNKPYFDPQGLFLAFDDARPVGFAHAGFAPNRAAGSELCYGKGITCLLVVSPGYEATPVAEDLLQKCEEYLLKKGAQVLYGGSASPWHPFYLGLYGGLQLPGVLESDTFLIDVFTRHQYVIDEYYRRFQLNLSGFQKTPDVGLRFQFSRFSLVRRTDARPLDWWDAVSYCESELTDFVLVDPSTERPVARVRYCKHSPNPHSWPAVGLAEIRVANGWREQNVEKYLLATSLTCLQQEGIAIVEAQCPGSDEKMVQLLKASGFQPATRGVVFRKQP